MSDVSRRALIGGAALGGVAGLAEAATAGVPDIALRRRSILDFGARNDGTSDIYDALLSALAAGGPVYFPAGRYRLARGLDFGALRSRMGLDIPHVVLIGDGAGLSTISFSGQGTMLTGGATPPAAGGTVQALTLQALSFEGMGQNGLERPLRFGRFATSGTDMAGTHSTQRGVYWEFAAPSSIERCRFSSFDRAIETKLGYNAVISNNDIRWNNLGIVISGAATSMTITNNLIERNAIGIGLWICSQIRILDNVLQGNYAGADIVSYNWNSMITVARNYFEASPVAFFHAGDSGGEYISNNYLFEMNKSLSCRILAFARHFAFERNRLISVEIGDQTVEEMIFGLNFEDEPDGSLPFRRIPAGRPGQIRQRS